MITVESHSEVISEVMAGTDSIFMSAGPSSAHALIEIRGNGTCSSSKAYVSTLYEEQYKRYALPRYLLFLPP